MRPPQLRIQRRRKPRELSKLMDKVRLIIIAAGKRDLRPVGLRGGGNGVQRPSKSP